MNSRRAFREIVKANREGSTQRSLLPVLPGTLRLFILFLFFSCPVFSQNIQNQQYDLNDPRNPNCPCHKLQKQADDAYQQLLNNEQQNKFQGNFSNINLADNNRSNFSTIALNNDANRSHFNPAENIGRDNSSHQQKREFDFGHAEKPSFGGSSASRMKNKKPGTLLSKKLNRTRLKHSKIKKVRPNYSVCYKW